MIKDRLFGEEVHCSSMTVEGKYHLWIWLNTLPNVYFETWGDEPDWDTAFHAPKEEVVYGTTNPYSKPQEMAMYEFYQSYYVIKMRNELLKIKEQIIEDMKQYVFVYPDCPNTQLIRSRAMSEILDERLGK